MLDRNYNINVIIGFPETHIHKNLCYAKRKIKLIWKPLIVCERLSKIFFVSIEFSCKWIEWME